MGERTRGSIVIEADRPTIMAEIADYETYPEWSGEIKAVEIREMGPDGRASKVYYEVSAGPITAKYTLAYAYDPDDAGVSWTFVEGTGLSDIQGRYILEPTAGGTEVTYEVMIDVSIPGPGFVKRKLLAEGEKRIIDTALKGLKKRVESKGG